MKRCKKKMILLTLRTYIDYFSEINFVVLDISSPVVVFDVIVKLNFLSTKCARTLKKDGYVFPEVHSSHVWKSADETECRQTLYRCGHRAHECFLCVVLNSSCVFQMSILVLNHP